MNRFRRHLCIRAMSPLWVTIGAFLFSFGAAVAGLAKPSALDRSQLMNGDVVFQQSKSGQSEAIRQATNSPWTHVGVLWKIDGEWSVFEASGAQVRVAPLDAFIGNGRSGEILVRRSLNRERLFGPEGEQKLRTALQRYLRRPYDALFEWGDHSIYCSELVWKAYRDAFGVQISEVEKVGDLNCQAPAVKALIEKRFKITEGQKAYDELLQEKIVSPARLVHSTQFVTIYPAE